MKRFYGFFMLTLLVVFSPLAGQAGEETPTVTERSSSVFSEAKNKLLRFRFKQNDIIEIKKYSRQEIKVNNKPMTRYVHHRVLLNVKGKSPSRGYRLAGSFESKFRLERTKGAPYRTEESHSSEFYLEPRGQFHVDDNVYMPNIRHIPLFPEDLDPSLDGKRKMKKGDTWSAEGTEVMSFDNLIKVPLEVNYEYGGSQVVKTNDGNKSLHKIIVNYNISYEKKKPEKNSPQKVFGYATAVYFWDESEHMPYYTQEDYNIIMLFANGKSSEFTIKSKSVYKKIKALAEKEKDKLQESLQAKLDTTFKDDKKNLPSVEAVARGLKISLPDILFEFNSSELTSKSSDVLDGIISVLSGYPDLRIQVRGHTDNVGKPDYNLQLSRKRAKNVVSYMLDESDMKSEQLSYEGYGETEPVASNKTEEGRKRNRRVELLILNE